MWRSEVTDIEPLEFMTKLCVARGFRMKLKRDLMKLEDENNSSELTIKSLRKSK